jgi:protein-L-isoaspartate O-methyltransferase
MTRKAFLAVVLLSVALTAQSEKKLAPFVPSPNDVVEKMLKLADVKAGDTVWDLGCGDGRIVITAAQKFGAKGVGVELDDDLYAKTSAHVKELGLEDKVKIIHGDLLEQDLSSATVVTLYLLPLSNEKVRPRLEKYLKKGARVVSHDFEMAGWRAYKTEQMESADYGREHTIYLYKIGEHLPVADK